MDDDLSLILSAVREAGAAALAATRDGVDSWEKSPGHPVTKVDLEMDALLKRRLRGERPAYGWLSEETVDDPARLDCERVFLVDPIDGTRDLIRGREGWAVAVAVAEAGAVTHAALYAPALGKLYAAQAGRGATLNGRTIAARANARLDDAKLCIDRDVPRSRHWAGPKMPTVYRPNSLALRIARIAAGEADATFDGRRAREYDTAAAALILTEAGGIITDEHGQPPVFNKPEPSETNFLATANKALHEELRPVFAETMANWRRGRK